MFWRHRTPIDGTGRAPIKPLWQDAIRAAALWFETEHYKIVGAFCRCPPQNSGSLSLLCPNLSAVSAWVDVIELLVISRALGVDALDLFTEIANTAEGSDR
jgi:hypothetical protein